MRKKIFRKFEMNKKISMRTLTELEYAIADNILNDVIVEGQQKLSK